MALNAKKARKIFDQKQNIAKCRCSGDPKCKTCLLVYFPRGCEGVAEIHVPITTPTHPYPNSSRENFKIRNKSSTCTSMLDFRFVFGYCTDDDRIH